MSAYSFSLYNWILIATTLIAIGVSIILWSRRKFNGVFWFFLLEIAAAEWALGIMFESAATSVALKELWSAIAFIGTCSVPPLFFLFAVEYNLGRKRIPRKLLYLLAGMVAFTIFMAFTNPLHNLLWTNITITPVLNVAIYEHGLIWWFILIYEYILILLAFYFLLRTAFKSGSFFASHNVAIIIGAILPMIGNIMYIFGPNPIPGLDWAPVGFALSGVVLAWSILKLKIFKIAPIARTVLVENMVDSMIVLDANDHIVDINPAAAELFQHKPKQMIGQMVYQFFPASLNLKKFLQVEKGGQTETELDEIQTGHIFELRLTILHDRFDQIIGKSLVLRDITEKKQAEAEREKLIHELQDALKQVKTLSGLLPICAHCKSVRDDQGYWHEVDEYIRTHAEVDFSHGICPNCIQKYYPEIAARLEARKKKKSD